MTSQYINREWSKFGLQQKRWHKWHMSYNNFSSTLTQSPVWWLWGSRCGSEPSGTLCRQPFKVRKHTAAWQVVHITCRILGIANKAGTSVSWSHEKHCTRIFCKRFGSSPKPECLTHRNGGCLKQTVVAGLTTCSARTEKTLGLELPQNRDPTAFTTIQNPNGCWGLKQQLGQFGLSTQHYIQPKKKQLFKTLCGPFTLAGKISQFMD
jgi:hypothetical protein